MTDRPERSERLKAEVWAILDRVNWKQSDLIEKSGVSEGTIGPLLRVGKIPYRRDIVRSICRTLGWSDDSISRILEGLEPIEIRPPAQTVQLVPAEGHGTAQPLGMSSVTRVEFEELAERLGRLEQGMVALMDLIAGTGDGGPSGGEVITLPTKPKSPPPAAPAVPVPDRKAAHDEPARGRKRNKPNPEPNE